MDKHNIYKSHTLFYCMAKKGGKSSGTTDYDQGTEAWNVADGYTKLKILSQLIMLDRWDTISQFGTEEIDEDINYTDEQLKRRRVEALQRFHSTIKQLLGNVKFALKKQDRPKIDMLMNRILIIDEFINKTYAIKQDEVSHTDIFEIKE